MSYFTYLICFQDEPPASLPADQWLKNEGFTSTQINFDIRDLLEKSKNEQSLVEQLFRKSEAERIPKISVDDFYEKKSLTAYQMIQKVSIISYDSYVNDS